jgi:hypothetical protein
MKTYYTDNKRTIDFQLFICPECGCKNDKIRGLEFFAKDLKTSNPWFEEFEFINCPKCIRSIPGSLGYRYGKTKTYDNAKKKWNNKFKNLFREHLVK